MRIKTRAYLSGLVITALLSSAGTCLLYSRRPAALPARSAAVIEESSDPVTRFRTERGQLRQQQKGQLNDIIHDPDGDPEAASTAQRRLLDLMAREEQEMTIEGILRAKGFDDVLAVVSEQAVNVILRRDGALTRRENAAILDVVLRETGVTGGNVKIIPIN